MTAANEALSTNQPAAVTFDTLSAVQELRKSGFEDPQAEALVKTINKAMNETVATKADLELLDSKTRAEFVETRAEIVATRKDLEAQIAKTRKDLEAQIAATRAEIVATRKDLELQIAELSAKIASVQDKLFIRLGVTPGMGSDHPNPLFSFTFPPIFPAFFPLNPPFHPQKHPSKPRGGAPRPFPRPQALPAPPKNPL